MLTNESDSSEEFHNQTDAKKNFVLKAGLAKNYNES
jgi:hypothetical protein